MDGFRRLIRELNADPIASVERLSDDHYVVTVPDFERPSEARAALVKTLALMNADWIGELQLDFESEPPG